MKRREVLTGTAATAAILTTGCMGKFALTTGLYKWNDSVTGSKFINQLLFWGLNILPVYSLAVAGDALIFNLIEFWTGSNLFAARDEADASRRLAVRGEHMEVSHRGSTFTATRVDERTVIVRRGHLVLGAALATEKGLVITDASGAEQAFFAPTELEAMERELKAALGS